MIRTTDMVRYIEFVLCLICMPGWFTAMHMPFERYHVSRAAYVCVIFQCQVYDDFCKRMANYTKLFYFGF